MKLRYTPAAHHDLQAIQQYLQVELCNPAAAKRLITAITAGCDQLKRFPKLGPSIQAKTGYETPLRMLTIEHYIVLYRVDEDVVSVGRILHAHQDYIRILFHDFK